MKTVNKINDACKLGCNVDHVIYNIIIFIPAFFRPSCNTCSGWLLGPLAPRGRDSNPRILINSTPLYRVMQAGDNSPLILVLLNKMSICLFNVMFQVFSKGKKERRQKL